MSLRVSVASPSFVESLLQGERPESLHIDDAVHWFYVYSALLDAAVTCGLSDKIVCFGGRREFWRRRWMEIRDR